MGAIALPAESPSPCLPMEAFMFLLDSGSLDEDYGSMMRQISQKGPPGTFPDTFQTKGENAKV